MSPPSARLLVCLTEGEEADFLPAPLDAELAQMFPDRLTVRPTNTTATGWAEHLHAANPGILLACWKTPPLPRDLPPALRYVCYLAGSVRQLVTRAQLEAGLLVTNWGSSISRVVAEGALVHVLSGLRHLTHWTLQMHRHDGWKDGATTTASLFGRRVGIRGYGRVAQELIALLAPFGCDIGVLAPDLSPATAAPRGIRCVTSLEELMGGHDVVVELAPLIPETIRSIRREHLDRLRPGAVFVNVGRGATVDEEALLAVAREGRIHVGLDVYSREPLPADSGFRGLPNVSLTPHLAGPTTDRRVDAGRFALENLRAHLDGQPLRALITPEVYDRST